MNDVTHKAGLIPDGVSVNKMKWDRHSESFYLSKKMFKDEIEKNPDKKVIGYTYSKQVDIDKNCCKLSVGKDGEEKYFRYKECESSEKSKLLRRVKGYTCLDDGNFVAVVRFPLLPFLLLLAFVITIIITITFCKKSDKPGLELENEHAIEEEEEREPYTETIDIPGYMTATLTEDKKEIQLINPESNTVYFIYTLTEDGNEICSTNAIIPGNSVMVDLWSVLDSGSHNITITISTFDVDSEESCNGASQIFEVIVNK